MWMWWRNRLQKHGFNAAALHGDLDQSVRTRTLDSFRSGELALLVASDVAARGLDIPAVSHIFNFDVPFHADDYVHRIGRTGRAGRSGHAFMLASSRDGKYVEAIEKLTGGKTIPRRKIEGIEVREDSPRNNDRNRGHDRNKGRNDNRGHRERPRADHGQRASMEPAQQTLAKAPVAHTPEPQAVQQQPKQHKPDHRQDHRPKPQQQKPQPQQRAEPKQPDAHQLPAFLLRPINVPKLEKPAPRAKKKSEDLDA